MLTNLKELYGRKLAATDGDIGHVKDFYFDDQGWVIRYLVADTGTWLTGRLVLLSPHSFAKWHPGEASLRIKLRKKQIEDSPSIASHQTVSRQFEDEYFRSYGWPVYWQGGEMWGMSGHPLALSPQPRDIAERKALEPSGDLHLQGAREVTGYAIHSTEGPIGHVGGFLVDDRSWAVRGLAVEAGHWYSGKEILISPDAVERISCEESIVFVNLTKADIQAAGEGNFVKSGEEIHGAA
jgi:hypothetical protein